MGLGIDWTRYGMLLDDRIDNVEMIELRGGNERIRRDLAERDRPELSVVAADHRGSIPTGDGRQHLSSASTRYDAITVDTVRPPNRPTR